jgi:hypothetical protein
MQPFPRFTLAGAQGIQPALRFFTEILETAARSEFAIHEPFLPLLPGVRSCTGRKKV